MTSSIHTLTLYNWKKNHKFLALSGIHLPNFQQSNRTTVIDGNSAETESRP